MKKSRIVWIVMSITLPFIFFACLDSDVPTRNFEQELQNMLAAVNKTQLAVDKKAIDDSLSNWDVPNVVKDSSGVRYTIETLGSAGPAPQLGQYLLAKYEGRFLKDSLNGPTFDAGELVGQFYLGDLIAGWQTVLPKFPQGSKVTLYIPSGLAYGPVDVRDRATGDILIPKNSNLIFKIELKGVK